MANVRVVPRSLTDAYKRREGDFAPNLVGFQFTNGVSLFTFGNFEITTNLDSRLNVNYTLGGEWSDYYSLENLNLTENQSQILMSNDIFVRLNFDTFNISRYVYFGSFYEFARVTLEEIIQSWKGSLYVTSQNSNTLVNTILSFNYNSGNDTAEFLIPKSSAVNTFQLNIDSNSDFDVPINEIYNLSRDYNKYVIWNIQINKEFSVIGYTGSTTSFPYIRIQTNGNPFPSLTGSTFGQINYHLKPNSTEVQLFFEQLTDFQKILLNRLTTPIYKATFDVPKEADGVFYYTTENFNWPVSDGYNLDISSKSYGDYVQALLDAANNFDLYKTDLVSRRFVSESIHEFDTKGGTANPFTDSIYGMKVSKLLRIYGREFDEVKKYIDGISFANVVTYDKLDNTSDELIKIIAKNLGFDVLLTVGTDNFNLLEQIKPSFQTPFSGYSRALSSKELDIELWRRLVINAWWLFKSKGTRKVIEFFFNLFKIPECMVSLNEYIYLAENRLNTQEVYEALDKIYGGPNLFNISDLPMDDYGFPRILPETQDNYFQMDGYWYNGGNTTTIGNNPHIGPYDFGKSYFNQFECFVPNFNDYLTGSSLVTVYENYFNNYNEGTFIFDQNGLPVPYYGSGYENTLNNGLVENAIVNGAGLTSVGGSNAPSYGVPSGDTYSMKINFTAGINKEICKPCDYQLVYGANGVVYISGNPQRPLTDQNCCQNYWLPNTTIRVTCPNTATLTISPDGIVNGITSAECCTENVVGNKVSWDGRNCIVTSDTIDCKKTSIKINLQGVAVNAITGELIGQACCTSAIIGSNVTWNGDRCVQTIVQRQVNYSASDLFTSSNDVVTAETPITTRYLCYWCPPQTNIVCSIDSYLTLLTSQQITQLATSLGWSGTGTPESFLSRVYGSFFSTYGCLYLDPLGQPITNQACCTLQGGIWTNISYNQQESTTFACVQPPKNPCPDYVLNQQYHIYLDTNNQPISQECCNVLGHQFSTNGGIKIYQNGVLTPKTLVDILPVNYFNQIGVNLTANTNTSIGYCTDCPLSINLTTNNFIVEYPSGAPLTQKCCKDFGLAWTDAGCKKPSQLTTLTGRTNTVVGGVVGQVFCPTIFNQSLPDFNVVYVTQNLNNISSQCCTQANGYYLFVPNSGAYVYNGVVYGSSLGLPYEQQTTTNATLCYQCPPKIDAGYLYVYDAISHKNILYYNGSPITSSVCCSYYNSTGLTWFWNPTNNRCEAG